MGPLELLARGRTELTRFGGHVTAAHVIDVRPVNDGFRVELSDGSQRTARRVLIATGVPASVGMSDHDRERLNARGITVLAGEPRRVLVTDDRLSGIEFVDGSVIERTVLVAGSSRPICQRLGEAACAH